MTASWAVVSTSVEPVDILVSFARHHLALGAAEVHVFLDRPAQDDADRLGLIPGLTVWCCDRAYWHKAIGTHRPKNVERRQILNARHVAGLTAADWLIHLDSDEFLYCDTDPAAQLSAVPDGVDVLRLDPMERAYIGQDMPTHVFEGGFRILPRQDPITMAYLLAPEMEQIGTYFLGHKVGKSFVRMGRNLRMGIHRPGMPRGAGRKRAVQMDATLMAVLHFDGFTPLHWLRKAIGYRERAANARRTRFQPGQERLIQRLVETGDDPRELWAIFSAAKMIPHKRAAQLRNLGLLSDVCDWRPNLDTSDEGPPPDLSVAAFDRQVDIDRSALAQVLAEAHLPLVA